MCILSSLAIKYKTLYSYFPPPMFYTIDVTLHFFFIVYPLTNYCITFIFNILKLFLTRDKSDLHAIIIILGHLNLTTVDL